MKDSNLGGNLSRIDHTLCDRMEYKLSVKQKNNIPMLSALSGQGCVEGRAPSVGEPPGDLPIECGSALTEAELSDYKFYSISEDQ